MGVPVSFSEWGLHLVRRPATSEEITNKDKIRKEEEEEKTDVAIANTRLPVRNDQSCFGTGQPRELHIIEWITPSLWFRTSENCSLRLPSSITYDIVTSA